LPSNINVTIADALLDARSIKGQGVLATRNSADWATQVTGTGKPANGATVGAIWNSTLSGIPNRLKDSASVGLNLTDGYLGYYDGTAFRSYIQSNGRFHFGSSTNNFLDYNGSQLAIKTTNFEVDPSGNARFKGALTASSFANTKLSIDALGNLNSSGAFRFGGAANNFVSFDGTRVIINTPKLTLDAAGNAVFAGSLSAATGTFAGTLSAATGSFKGRVEMDTGYIASSVTIGGLGSLANKDSVAYNEVTGTKPPTNADNTGSNTSANTNAVAGTAATTVRDQAAGAATTTTRVNNWIKPNSTFIDGNKIFTGDAYVDTLQIAGDAITANTIRQVFRYWQSTNYRVWQNYDSFTYSHADTLNTIPCIFFFRLATFSSDGVPGSMRIKRGSTVLQNFGSFANGWLVFNIPPGQHTFHIEYYANNGRGRMGMMSSEVLIMGAAR